MNNIAASKELATEISEVIQRTHNVKSFRVSDKGVVQFKAGQFCCVSLSEEKELCRWLSISSSPTEKGYIEFTKKLTDSEFSRMIDNVDPGDPISIKYSFGNFVLKEDDKKVAFLSGGIGITPIRSICKYVCDERRDTDIVLLYGSHCSGDIVFKEDLDEIEEECPNVKVVHILSQPGDSWPGEQGHVNKHLIQKYIPDFTERIFYICGPPLMVSGMKSILKDELNLQDDNIVIENFVGY